VTAFTFRNPLDWPTGWPRAKRRERSRFGVNRSAWAAGEGLSRELNLLRAHEVNITTNLRVRVDGYGFLSNQGQPPDPAAAVYFRLGKERRPIVLACDAWDRVEDNLHALRLHVGAIRGQERWGVGTVDRAFDGYIALPPANGNGMPWWCMTLGIDSLDHLTSDDVRTYFRDGAMVVHPDKGGSSSEMDRLIKAREAAMEFLAGKGK